MKRDESIEALKKWVHWKRCQKTASEEDILLVESVMTLIAVVGTLQAQVEKLKESVNAHTFAPSDQQKVPPHLPFVSAATEVEPLAFDRPRPEVRAENTGEGQNG